MKPLNGITVLDLSRYPPGRYCTLLLSDLGAEVITIEAVRDSTAQVDLITDDLGAVYLTVNRNKKSLALDLRSEQGREVFFRLAEKADVIVEGFRPGVVKRLGVDYESVEKINSGIVYCSISGYGQDGPYADRPGHDINYVGLAGVLSLTGERNGAPVIPGTQIADLGGGYSQAVIGILAGLLGREKSGKGQHIDISMMDGVVSWLWVQAAQYFLDGALPGRGENLFTGSHPYYNIYQTNDGGYITLGIAETWFWEKLCRLLGKDEFIPFMDDEGEKREEIFAAFKQIFLTKTKEEWVVLLDEANIPSGPVNNLEEVFDDPHVVYRRMVMEQEHPVLGKIRQLGCPLKISGMESDLGAPPPRYGGHTRQILQTLGYDDAKIAGLRDAGVIE